MSDLSNMFVHRSAPSAVSLPTLVHTDAQCATVSDTSEYMITMDLGSDAMPSRLVSSIVGSFVPCGFVVAPEDLDWGAS